MEKQNLQNTLNSVIPALEQKIEQMQAQHFSFIELPKKVEEVTENFDEVHYKIKDQMKTLDEELSKRMEELR